MAAALRTVTIMITGIRTTTTTIMNMTIPITTTIRRIPTPTIRWGRGGAIPTRWSRP